MRSCGNRVRFASCILAAVVITTLSAAAASIRIDPRPAVAGQAISVTFESEAFTCNNQGRLAVVNVAGNELELKITPPDCPVIPIAFLPYTATTALPPLSAGTYTVRVYDDKTYTFLTGLDFRVENPPVCSSTGSSLCLMGRFDVRGTWEDFAHRTGTAAAVEDSFQGFGSYGLLWFFNKSNPEITVKALDACAQNGRFWIFISPGSTVRYDVTVRDVITGISKTFSNPKGASSPLFSDTETFRCSRD